MIILYRPEGADEQQFDVRSVRTSEAQIVARTTDMTWTEIKAGIRDDDPTALRGIAWVLLKRQNPTLRWSEFDPLIGDLVTRFDDREVDEFVHDLLRLPEERQPRAIEELRYYAASPDYVDIALKAAAEPPKGDSAQTSTPDAAST
ncbi:hypothetical protein ACLF6K_37525 [Streptomyces xanthophaeus]|uniref:hypothetical protein n=1 Tax=Streptomyces xanthophaeus TaxID=67385 RepID=UPI00398FC1CB